MVVLVELARCVDSVAALNLVVDLVKFLSNCFRKTVNKSDNTERVRSL
jgi:hypothetical protein